MDKQLGNLDRELEQWKMAGKKVRLWLRDDDAIDVTTALEELCALVEGLDIPLLLAVIPKFATPELGEFVRQHGLIAPAVHGYSHTNHAAEGDKKCEFHDGRSQHQMQKELAIGRELLSRLFGKRLSPLLVPPWNRIGDKAIKCAMAAGFAGISGFGWKEQPGGRIWQNTHVDVINWKGKKRGKSLACVLGEICTHLEIARQNNFVPIGLLTHHRDHDAALWGMLDQLIETLNKRNIKWIDGSLYKLWGYE